MFCFPTIGSLAQGKATLLAIDDYALPLKRNLRLRRGPGLPGDVA